jgi:acetyltransferase-like isoleucine patch superfamily enzyme
LDASVFFPSGGRVYSHPNQDVAPYTVVAGNPAKVIKQAPRNTTTAEERAEIRKIADAA